MTHGQAPPRKFAFRIALSAAMFLLVGFASLGVGVAAYGGSRLIAERLSTQVFEGMFDTVEAVARGHLDNTTSLLDLNHRLYTQGFVTPGTIEHRRYLLEVLEAQPIYSSLGHGDEQGNAIWARVLPDGRVVVDEYQALPGGGSALEEWGLADDGSWELLDADPATTYDPRVRPWYLAGRDADAPVWTEPYLFVPQNRPGVTVARALRGPDGGRQGVIILDFELQLLSEPLSELEAAKHGRVFIVDGAGRILAHSRPEVAVAPEGASNIRQAAQSDDGLTRAAAAALDPDAPGRKRIDHDGIPYVLLTSPFDVQPGMDWQIVLAVPEDLILAPVRRAHRLALGVSLLAVFLSLVASRFFSHQITVGLTRVIEEIDRVNRFELEPRPIVASRIVEIEKVAVALEAMKSGLRSFGKYVPVELVRTLLDRGVEAQVGGRRRTLTLMFTDLEGFTEMSERMEPEDLAAFLGDYLGACQAIVAQHGGTVDKYIGDAVMAFWGAPEERDDHAAGACRAALALAAMTAGMRRPDGRPLRVRIGLHTGDVVVGNFGSPDRLDYTAFGDAVNLASRLEGANKGYGTRIVLSEATATEAGDGFVTRTLDRVAVKGRQQGVRILELLGDADTVADADLAYAQAYETAFDHYLAQRWNDALAGFLTCLQLRPDDKAAAQLHARCQQLQQSPPDGWSGVHDLTWK